MPYADPEKRRAYHREYGRRYYASNPEYRAGQKSRQQSPAYKASVKRYRATKRGRDFANAALRRYFKTPKGIAARRRYAESHPLELAARSAVLVARRSGKLKRKPCEVCGNKKVEAHHDNYSRPLEVRWLCKKHHEQQEE